MNRIRILLLFWALPALAGEGMDARVYRELCNRIAGDSADSGDPLRVQQSCELAAQAYLVGKSLPCTAASRRNFQLELAQHLCLKSPSFAERSGQKIAVKGNCYRTVAAYFGLRENPDSCERFGPGAGPCYRKRLDAEREKARDQVLASGIVARIKSLFGQADSAEDCPSVPAAAITENARAKPETAAFVGAGPEDTSGITGSSGSRLR